MDAAGVNQAAPGFNMRPTRQSRVRTGLTCAIDPLEPWPASRNRLAIPAAKRMLMWDEHNTRKPILLLRLFGWLLLRTDERTLSGLLFQEPPRTTRA